MSGSRSMAEKISRFLDRRIIDITAALALAVMMLALLSSCGESDGTVFSGKGLDTGEPGMNIYSGKKPGEASRLELPYPGAPPLVPHAIDTMNITREKNDCMGCHKDGITIGQDVATKIPGSHYEGTSLAGIRYNCRQCHVPQAEGEPPV